MRFKFPELEPDEHDYFQDLIARMGRAGWIESSLESSERVLICFTAAGHEKMCEMAKLVQPMTDYLRDKRRPKPLVEIQVACMAAIAPLAQELTPPVMEEGEDFKLLGLLAKFDVD